MGLLITNAKNMLINIAIYAILFNIIYSILFSGIKYPKTASILAYIIIMEIKLFTAPYKITLLTFFISIVVYLILGLIIVKILDKMANYKPRKSFVIIGIIISYLVELLVVRVLFFAVRAVIDILIVLFWIIKYYFQAWFSITFNLH